MFVCRRNLERRHQRIVNCIDDRDLFLDAIGPSNLNRRAGHRIILTQWAFDDHHDFRRTAYLPEGFRWSDGSGINPMHGRS
jgi:hypothetical protein